ncbi:hypothetical protein HY503_00540 [Candidatus Woesebacteria bacterium]|nr:hypothetical protein [Candidatus Woesebacteria bacterium]
MQERGAGISRIKDFLVGIYRDYESKIMEIKREEVHLRTITSLYQANLITHEEYLQRLAQQPDQSSEDPIKG